MISEIRRIIRKWTLKFKVKVYGRTFVCPVCHLELSHFDVDENGMCVCPVCGAVLEVRETHGHSLPVVLDMEIPRYAPNMRLHPLATHLPIALMPLAFFGALLLVVVSLIESFSTLVIPIQSIASSLGQAVLLFLYIASAFSLLTTWSGLFDWKTRFRGRSYRIIWLKMALSLVFFASGVLAAVLHHSGLVFSLQTGLISWDVVTVVFLAFYLLLLMVQFIAMATLGHLGGYLVYGR